jgi:peptidoglycan/LPS O-acetylase OafA/YrhL
MSGSKRIFWVDIVRILAIVLVVVFHFFFILSLDNNLRPIGYVGVSLFFMVSGFMLAKHDPNRTSFDLGWLWKRYVKISSLYYPTVIAIALLFGTQAYGGSVWDIALHLIYLNGFFPRLAYSIISAGWFLLPLLGLYIFFPFLNYLTRKYPAFIAIAALISFVSRLSSIEWVSVSALFFISEFCFGMKLAEISDRKENISGKFDKNDLWLLSPLILGLITWVIALPYLIFYLFSLLPKIMKSDPSIVRGISSFVGMHTFEIFLFHEALIMVALGLWNINGMDRVLSMIVLLVVLGAAMAVSNMINGMLIGKPANETGSRTTGKPEGKV